MEEENKFNYEFDDYEEDEQEENVGNTLEEREKQRPKVNLLKSRWSPHSDNLKLLNDIRWKLKELGIKISADSKNIDELKNFLAINQQIFFMIKGFLGSKNHDETKNKIKELKLTLRKMEEQGYIDDDQINDDLIELQENIEDLLDHLNLNLEKSKIYDQSSRAEDMITQ